MADLHLFDELCTAIRNSREEMIELQRILTAESALGPDSGGMGEWKKADALETWLEKHHFPKGQYFNAPDERAERGSRPNFIVRYPGQNHDRCIWIMTHLDIVPPGDLSLWHSDPYELVVEDDRIIGRGVEDNQQGLVASVFALKSLIDAEVVPPYDIALAFVADEETGSQYGLDYLVKNHSSLFGKDDIIIIPDAGNPAGTLIEIAEKTIFWLQFTVLGKQTHASRPDGGINAFRAGSYLIVALDDFFQSFTRENSLFEPPTSTFQPTMKEANVPNINTIPGKDVFCFDCRILPEEDLESVENGIDRICRLIEKEHRVTITRKIVQQTTAALPTPPESDVVQLLQKGIKDIIDAEGVPTGVGGGTVANFLRLQGIPVAVWSKHAQTAHQPNEYCLLENLVIDAQVFVSVFLMRR